MQKCSWLQPFCHSPLYFDYRIQVKKILRNYIFTLEMFLPFCSKFVGANSKGYLKLYILQSHILLTFVGLNVNPNGGKDQAVSLIKVSQRVLPFKRLYLLILLKFDVRAHTKSLFLYDEETDATTSIRVSLQYFISKIIKNCVLTEGITRAVIRYFLLLKQKRPNNAVIVLT